MNLLYRGVALRLSVLALLAFPVSNVAAQEAAQPPCPFANDRVVSQSLGTQVHGYADSSMPGYDQCEFGDITLIRQSGAFARGSTTLLGLAQNVVLGLPEPVAAQIAVLGLDGVLDVPGYQIATPSGLGDAAVWVKNSSFGVDALVIQRGTEVFALQVLDRPDAQAQLTALGRAVLANAPAAVSASPPSGDRPVVLAECSLDSANAVADRLQRSDVSSINVIGGCHYVAIATTLDGSGFENADTASQMCDVATAVAYSGVILGITVTDRNGNERASGTNGEPCSGFP